ncbi:hypothetical protein BKA56DRAFT_345486 [Ilyonectria sp. MPI-CAGE-AT-0026]|nr:hypothetical protein BKA56DRAFT_345486 [Ilyonectria sp. MPI-CAGE-AT-0026]
MQPGPGSRHARGTGKKSLTRTSASQAKIGIGSQHSQFAFRLCLVISQCISNIRPPLHRLAAPLVSPRLVSPRLVLSRLPHQTPPASRDSTRNPTSASPLTEINNKKRLITATATQTCPKHHPSIIRWSARHPTASPGTQSLLPRTTPPGEYLAIRAVVQAPLNVTVFYQLRPSPARHPSPHLAAASSAHLVTSSQTPRSHLWCSPPCLRNPARVSILGPLPLHLQIVAAGPCHYLVP